MSVTSPNAAIKLVLGDLQSAATCVTKSVLRAQTVADDKTRASIGFAGSPRAKIGRGLERWISIVVVVEAAPETGSSRSWRTHTQIYDFSLFDRAEGGDFLLAYHYHPSLDGSGFQGPHMHVGARPTWARGLKKKHLPTGRVSVEDFITLLIDELGIRRTRGDWRAILESGQRRFAERRTW